MFEDSPQATGPTPEEIAQARKREHERRRLRRLRITFPLLLLVVFLAWAYTTNYIPSESMSPTLQPGDHILAMRAWLAYPRGRLPARGDIVTFLPPKAAMELVDAGPPDDPRSKLRRQEVWIKRVVGLPNEEVWVFQGRVYINGTPLPAGVYRGEPNVRHAIFPFASSESLKLGPDELFVLGDNSDHSEDSRLWGPLKRDRVVGKYLRVLFREGPGGPNQRRAESSDG